MTYLSDEGAKVQFRDGWVLARTDAKRLDPDPIAGDWLVSCVDTRDNCELRAAKLCPLGYEVIQSKYGPTMAPALVIKSGNGRRALQITLELDC